ncbi:MULTISPECIES: hypothetical protein [Pseudomonas]|uniref:Uncharacterized protein n=1 Tax=Pseudomonas putida TaxID=303 RepID=A0A1B2F9D0_PSEPU|nr:MULTISPECIES: hypothetical protein [Pseudomonas]ANY88755.1 hypothetical protein IEC33019_3228 [Pseudomonas putida]MCL8305580.1 hypothetical protein [Pseudomonas putida]
MTTPAANTRIIDGNGKLQEVAIGEMDEAIAYDNPTSSQLNAARVYFNYELFDLYKAANVHIQRRLIEALDDGAVVASVDEMLVWLTTTDVTLHQDSALILQADGQALTIRQASPEQRIHLLFMGAEAPAQVTDGLTLPLRVDGNAGAQAQFEVTAIDHLYLYGTPQFQERVFEQLALLPGYPQLNQLLEGARKQYTTVPDIVLMQCHAGPTQQGPGFDLHRAMPEKYAHLLPAGYIAVLYDPYDATGLDGLTTLLRMLQNAYDSLASGMLLPAPALTD